MSAPPSHILALVILGFIVCSSAKVDLQSRQSCLVQSGFNDSSLASVAEFSKILIESQKRFNVKGFPILASRVQASDLLDPLVISQVLATEQLVQEEWEAYNHQLFVPDALSGSGRTITCSYITSNDLDSYQLSYHFDYTYSRPLEVYLGNNFPLPALRNESITVAAEVSFQLTVNTILYEKGVYDIGWTASLNVDAYSTSTLHDNIPWPYSCAGSVDMADHLHMRAGASASNGGSTATLSQPETSFSGSIDGYLQVSENFTFFS